MNHHILFAGIFAMSLLAASAAELPKLDRQPKPGVYALTNTSNYVTSNGKRVNLFDLPVDGVTNYATWRMVQPEEGAIRYPGLDRMIGEAVASGKYLSYGILAGIHTPDWVYEKGKIPRFLVDPNRKWHSYLPWFEVNGKRKLNTPFLNIWSETVKAFAARLYADPHRDRINYVPVTGFPFGNGLELYVPLAEPEFRALRYDGEARRLYVEFCCRVIDIFVEHLPDFPLGIAFTDWYGTGPKGHIRDVTESAAILDYAIRKGRLKGVTIVPMGLWMGWKGICDNPAHPLMRTWLSRSRQAGSGAWEGQMGSCRLKCLPLAEQLELAERHKAVWVQLWHHDCLCPECVAVLEAYRARKGASAK
ncbi:hypothetical protein [Victivallis vadensis]|uniref:hypothetical protein n=1 Tax=Victivallis vadensis TaxID=172901 RepID=UPI00266C26BC|nr:hypothetical protein [Victivallis vadensis]